MVITTKVSPDRERWYDSFHDAPDIFHSFSLAEDPAGLIPQRLMPFLPQPPARLLEIGCGSGRLTRDLARQGTLIAALDLSPGLLAHARRMDPGFSRWVAGRGEALPFPTGAFEGICANFVLAHLRPGVLRRVLAECDRVLAQENQGIWLVENHGDSEFQRLRGASPESGYAEMGPLIDTFNFRIIDDFEIEIRFESMEHASKVLGYLLGAAVGDRVLRERVDHLNHRVVILHRAWG